ncbi:MAG: cation transporter [Oscillospiraceae bacterium]|nr:cation transporter [Oscillospiraceae bacterium]
MTKLLMKICLPKGRPATDPKTRSAAGKLSGVVGIGCNVLLFGLKFLIGTLSGAVSVVADAMNNLTDAGSAVVTLVGFRLAEKPADEDHPYGHARFEYLSGLAVAVMIILIGFELAKTSVGKIIDPQGVNLSVPMFLALGGSVLVKLWLSLFNTRLGKHIDSAALLATAADSRNDCISTVAVILAALAQRLTNWHLDGFVGLGVAGFILWSGAKAVKETISPLLGESASPELQRDIIRLLKDEPAVLGYHDLMVHDYGPGQRFGSLHVEMDQARDALWCHELIDNLERKSLQELGVHLVIHYDPVAVGDPETDSLRQLLADTLKNTDPRLTLHDFRMVKGSGHTNLIFDIALPHDLAGREKEIRRALENALAENRQGTYYLVITFDRGVAFEG